MLEPYWDDIIPKKAELQVAKCEGKVNVVMVDNQPIFYNVRDGPYYPTLRVLHQYPHMMSTMRVDKGAVRFVLSGAPPRFFDPRCGIRRASGPRPAGRVEPGVHGARGAARGRRRDDAAARCAARRRQHHVPWADAQERGRGAGQEPR